MDTGLMAGVGKMRITPPFDCEMSGFVARKDKCRGVHDDLFARALVLSDGRRKVALVNTISLGIDHHLLTRVRREMAAYTDISPESANFRSDSYSLRTGSLKRCLFGSSRSKLLSNFGKKYRRSYLPGQSDLGTGPSGVWVK